MYGRLGANVVINDVSEKGAKSVVDEITQGQSGYFKLAYSDTDTRIL